ncbi:Cyclic nucleotide-binding domain-containing protein [Desulfocicer vacuolatum DSM 3385]|uniref:Cyclic nucleotide-binding domain-containing protein n=1 Tax=Desulfocicer vacuolatum DSM 3385 TaxID=1121400 RepID=A0A1W2E870_9BACT|nr:cyclic nucleotide-binding domain-containing protein [Desulfocicer vacuolatum]SMD05934.1 Cyclic nucleotide-binding domain-containing protein [Desulfocicer vacuolatum DSM 3385]
MVSLEMIEDLKIFENFEKSELAKILEICVVENYQQGDRLFCEGDEAKNLWIVRDGEVQLRFEMPNSKPSTDDTAISSHDNENAESQVFGWSCFIPPYQMRLSAYCATRRCEVIKINGVKIKTLMSSDPVIGYKVMTYLVQVVGFRFKQMQEEVAKFIGINMMNSW